jgi:hypothetical protein
MPYALLSALSIDIHRAVSFSFPLVGFDRARNREGPQSPLAQVACTLDPGRRGYQIP